MRVSLIITSYNLYDINDILLKRYVTNINYFSLMKSFESCKSQKPKTRKLGKPKQGGKILERHLSLVMNLMAST